MIDRESKEHSNGGIAKTPRPIVTEAFSAASVCSLLDFEPLSSEFVEIFAKGS